jgi:glutathionyl-hydroquinone reductase
VEKGLSGAISVSYARPRRTPEGWVFDADGPYSDGLKGVSALHEVYAQDAAPYTGRITVPLLWDKVADRAVSNESADIVRMLNDAFGMHSGAGPGAGGVARRDRRVERAHLPGRQQRGLPGGVRADARGL